MAAIKQKVDRRYGSPAVLVVAFYWPFMFLKADLESLARRARALGASFKEIWIVTAHRDPPQRLPQV